jgi:dTDP-4-dehydrorhamnose 3,5-epimerase
LSMGQAVERTMRQYGLEGVITHTLDVAPDTRGFFREALRHEWTDFVSESVLQANLSCTYPNVVRAWHRHSRGQRGQVDYFLVVRGAIQMCAYDDETGGLSEVIASEANATMVRIPGPYYHGTKTIGNETSLTIYLMTRFYDYRDPDEQRRLWNDPRVVRSQTNAKKDDPRVGNPWDWFYPPHK